MKKIKKVWVISVDMGYGHQRAAYPLKDIAFDRIITANSEKIASDKDLKMWRRFRNLYEGLSRFESVPYIGKIIWKIYDKLQDISPLYPFRDLSKPNFGALYLDKLIRKGFLKSIIDYTKKESIPIVSTFFATSIAAAYSNTNQSYCIVTDSDINRIWVPKNPNNVKLFYFAPTDRSQRRLIEYGVPKENIYFTGFPLPKENLGKNLEILKKDLGERLPNLDPNKIFISRYKDIIKKNLEKSYKTKSNHPLTITFVNGGAGAQKEIGASILMSLKDKIKNNEVRLNLIAGNRIEIEQYYKKEIEKLCLSWEMGKYINILCTLDKKTHFKEFNDLLHTTDILWTKPSELSFFCAFGIPLILSPPLGKHENYNVKWLNSMGVGFIQENPLYTHEWLFDLLNKGILAEAAYDGFTKAPKCGIYNIEKVLFSEDKNNLKFKY